MDRFRRAVRESRITDALTLRAPLHEYAIVAQVFRDILEALDLFFLGQQIVKGVEDHEDQAVRSFDTYLGIIAHRHRDPVTTRLCAKLLDHCSRKFDAVHLQPALRQRQADSPSANRELQGRTIEAVLASALLWSAAFALYFVVDKQMPALEAIKASISFVNKNLGTLIGFFLASLLAYFVGALLCGIGLLAAIPVVIIVQAYTYRTLQGEAVAA